MGLHKDNKIILSQILSLGIEQEAILEIKRIAYFHNAPYALANTNQNENSAAVTITSFSNRSI